MKERKRVGEKLDTTHFLKKKKKKERIVPFAYLNIA